MVNFSRIHELPPKTLSFSNKLVKSLNNQEVACTKKFYRIEDIENKLPKMTEEQKTNLGTKLESGLGLAIEFLIDVAHDDGFLYEDGSDKLVGLSINLFYTNSPFELPRIYELIEKSQDINTKLALLFACERIYCFLENTTIEKHNTILSNDKSFNQYLQVCARSAIMFLNSSIESENALKCESKTNKTDDIMNLMLYQMMIKVEFLYSISCDVNSINVEMLHSGISQIKIPKKQDSLEAISEQKRSTS